MLRDQRVVAVLASCRFEELHLQGAVADAERSGEPFRKVAEFRNLLPFYVLVVIAGNYLAGAVSLLLFAGMA